MFGLELVRATSGAPGKAEDCVVTLVHWSLLTKGLRCSGLGEAFESADTETSRPSEILPQGWNSGPAFALKYRHAATNEKFVLKAVTTKPFLTVILVRVGDEKSGSLNVEIGKEVRRREGDDEEGGPSFELVDEDVLVARVESELLSLFFKKEPPESSAKKSDEQKRDDRDPDRGPSRPPGGRDPPGRDPFRDPWPDMPRHPFRPDHPGFPFGPGGGGVPDPFFDQPGGADLDPFGRRGGGGMFMGPNRGGGLGGSGPFMPRFM